MPERRIESLAKIELNGTRSVAIYARTGRDLHKDLSIEYEWSAMDFQAAIQAEAKGNPWAFGADVWLRARRVARFLKRAAKLNEGAGKELIRFNAAYRKHFPELIKPPKKPKAKRRWDMEDE